MCIRDRYQRRVRGLQPAAMEKWLVLGLMATLAVCLADPTSSLPSELLNEHAPAHVVGKLSMLQLHETAAAAAEGQEVMDESMQMETKKEIVRLSSNFKSSGLAKASIQATRLAKQILFDDADKTDRELGEDDSKVEAGSGLDLIFRKLNELEKKINGEQAQDDAAEAASQDACREAFKNGDSMVEWSSTTRSNNQLTISESSAKIEHDRARWRESRVLEDQNHDALVTLQQQRTEESEAVRARVDERNKAIDVLVKATFMVCQRFNRYKNSPQCLEIKSQPDVDEPNRYETKKYAKAKIETEELHKSEEWKERWEKQVKDDYDKEGKPNPESDGGGISENIENAKGDDEAPAVAAGQSAVQLLQIGLGSSALSEEEQAAVKELSKMANDRALPEKYALPINELALALKAGAMKRSKSIVEILLHVLKETRQEQADDKATHGANLHSYYVQSWDLKSILNREADLQGALRRDMEELRLHILELSHNSEEERVNQDTAFAAKTSEEDRCALTSEEYGVRTTIRREDLENLVKLKSLLRALYWKRHPKACPRYNRVICTAKQNGWCVFMHREKSNNEQRCSCNVGFYGDACQFKTCPGAGKSLYQAGAPGVCSDRGACNRITGLCYCRDGYYHGPKNACDYKHAPPSKAEEAVDVGAIDDQCSMRGSLDPIRGRCNCLEEFFGPGCEEKKCPNSNGVLYPRQSGNACNGRGACSIDTGKCGCGHPYSGTSCEFEACPNDCLNRGNCNQNTGHCSCGNDQHGNPYVGPSCEFRTCPYDCTGGGECNRNDGTCICKDGYSGIQCEKTTRCPKATLHNDNMNWWTIWDKPGWMVCPKGQLMFQLKRSLCEALSCVDSGGCAAPCEGTTANNNHVFQTRHCYHDLRWYNSFDTAGTSECLTDYFVAGLFRSCESLYCLNMAKCCSLKEARWTKCTWTNWAIFNGPGTGKVGRDQFIVGFKRGEGHQLKNLDEAKGCEFVRGY
eukprot:TRINITY_DN680_c0_g3_i4.p1 TRINITY_DN680_c0_g3~~TRINITY_DN680_c0_g3_i4.p1  ORF type:complete len:986 (+),score=282.82 TRINITY_DN680_c0_g3_i4:31-2958(+)